MGVVVGIEARSQETGVSDKQLGAMPRRHRLVLAIIQQLN